MTREKALELSNIGGFMVCVMRDYLITLSFTELRKRQEIVEAQLATVVSLPSSRALDDAVERMQTYQAALTQAVDSISFCS